MIELRSVTASFAGRIVVDGVSLSVAAGEALGIVGESGSGKSTILRVIAGLQQEWRGSVTLAGTALGPRRPRSVARQVQMVFQDPYGSLYPRHTVDRALAEPLAIHGIADAAARIAGALAAVGLDGSHRFRYPHQLSGGQRQRVAIARALILAPEFLLLDEPTAALDAVLQAEILILLERLRRERRLAYILVSHNLAVVARLCDRIAVMREGRIVEEFATAQLGDTAARHRYTAELLQASRGYRRGDRR
jgi:peptide/nickel transport system ATP-binding protein